MHSDLLALNLHATVFVLVLIHVVAILAYLSECYRSRNITGAS